MSWRLAADHPDNEWILGCQIIQFQWDVPEMPTAAMIDEYISDRPVFLQQVDLHTFSANTWRHQQGGSNFADARSRRRQDP